MRAELERLGALREEAQAAGKARFAKLTLTRAGCAKPQPKRARVWAAHISPLELAGADTLPPEPSEDTPARRLERSPQSAAPHFEPQSADPNPRSKSAGKSPTRAGFLPFSGASPAISMEELSPRERSVGIGEEGVGTLQSAVVSSLSERGAARAGGRASTALGATFPGRPDRGRSARPGRSLCSLQLQPGAKPLSRGLGADPLRHRSCRERLERTSGASVP